MALKNVYVCSQCGETFAKWSGKCMSCGSWNSLIEEVVEVDKGKSAVKAVEKKKEMLSFLKESKSQKLSDISVIDDEYRIKTDISELDRVLGGGFVKGSFILLGGEPGAGKSTLVLHICDGLKHLDKILYVTGEESVKQVKIRADRLNVKGDNVDILAENNIERIIKMVENDKPDFLIIDSIQTMVSDEIPSSAGTVSQVKECSSTLIDIAKKYEIPTIIIGHVNKDGAIAGPKVLEHLVDTVLYFEGDKMLPFRILRAVKNRYGSTNEIGMFDMTAVGLKEIKNPSEALLAGRPTNVSGSCITCVIEGTRPVLSEIQVLATGTNFGQGRRTSNGFDFNRANLIYAVVEKRAGYNVSDKDVYINVVGGLKLTETACDLAVATSTISSILNKPFPEKIAVVGEIGLGGEIRAVNFIESRIKEAEKLGFETIIIPKHNYEKLNLSDYTIKIKPIAYLKEIVNVFKDGNGTKSKEVFIPRV